MEREWNERPTFEVGWLLKCKGCGATFTDTPPGFEKGYCHYCWVNRAEDAESRVRELEASCAAMRDALENAERYMTKKGVSHEYPVMINARKALSATARCELLERAENLLQEIGYLRNDLDAEREAREAAESRVRELEASCAAMREVLELSDYKGERLSIVAGEDRPVRLLCDQYGYGAVMDSAARQWRNKLGSYGDGALMVGHSAAVVRAALSTTAGYDLLRRLEKLELVAEAVREYKNYAWKPYNHRTFSQEALGSLEKRVCDSLAAMDS